MTEVSYVPPRKIKTSDLQLGDIVSQMDKYSPFSTCVVTQIKEGVVHLFRPYGTTADFSYTGGVIPYIGIEQYVVEVDSNCMWTLFRRQELK